MRDINHLAAPDHDHNRVALGIAVASFPATPSGSIVFLYGRGRSLKAVFLFYFFKAPRLFFSQDGYFGVVQPLQAFIAACLFDHDVNPFGYIRAHRATLVDIRTISGGIFIDHLS